MIRSSIPSIGQFSRSDALTFRVTLVAENYPNADLQRSQATLIRERHGVWCLDIPCEACLKGASGLIIGVLFSSDRAKPKRTSFRGQCPYHSKLTKSLSRAYIDAGATNIWPPLYSQTTHSKHGMVYFIIGCIIVHCTSKESSSASLQSDTAIIYRVGEVADSVGTSGFCIKLVILPARHMFQIGCIDQEHRNAG